MCELNATTAQKTVSDFKKSTNKEIGTFVEGSSRDLI
jgi:hypothetical protein